MCSVQGCIVRKENVGQQSMSWPVLHQSFGLIRVLVLHVVNVYGLTACLLDERYDRTERRNAGMGVTKEIVFGLGLVWY